MKISGVVGLLLCSNLLLWSAENEQLFANLGDFTLESGAIIKNCRIGYRTFGTLNAARSNAILYPTWFGGTSGDLANLIGPDKLIDSKNYFIIAVDALGNGVSSSPSNSIEQPGETFPQFTIGDMAQSQYRLVTEVLKIKKLYGIIGGSMGSFQVFEWLASYPDFIEKAIPYLCSPRLTSTDCLLWELQLRIIQNGGLCHLPDETLQPTLNMLTALLAETPQRFNQLHPTEQLADYLKSFEGRTSPTFTIANRASQLRAMQQYDITRKFGGKLEKAAKAVRAKVMIIVNPQDRIVNPQPALDFAPLIKAEVLMLNNDCGHYAIGCEMELVCKKIAEFLSK